MSGNLLIKTTCFFLGIFLLWHAGKAEAQGFAGMGTRAQGFETVVPGRALAFPADFGAHPTFQIEWWYVTANLKTDDGRYIGLQWTLFRRATKPGVAINEWSSHEFWMGHAAVTTSRQHLFSEKLARGGIGQAGATAAPFEAWIDDWIFAKADTASTSKGRYRLSANGDRFAYDLNLHTDQAPILNGDKGFSQKAESGQASYYFSVPSFTVDGTVTIAGEPVTVSGRAWLDREWSSQPLSETQEGWDWFSLHLDSGDKLMLFQLRDTENAPYFSGTWITPEGETEALQKTDISLTPLDRTDTGGRLIPTRWRLEIPSKSVSITTEALNPESWMNTSVPYWEGPVTATGTHSAEGYLEMTGY